MPKRVTYKHPGDPSKTESYVWTRHEPAHPDLLWLYCWEFDEEVAVGARLRCSREEARRLRDGLTRWLELESPG